MQYVNIYLLISVLLIPAMLIADRDQLPPRPASWVNDYTRSLSAVEIGTLNELLSGLEQRSSNQIFIALFDRIPGGFYIEDFVVELYDRWRPGLPEQDNGMLIVIFVADRQMRIEVGYGLEDVVTDAQAGQVIRDIMAPAFKQGNYYQGIRAALDILIPAVEGKYKIPLSQQNQQETGIPLTTIFIGIMIILIISRIIRGPRSAGYGTRRRGGGLFFPGPIIGGFGGGRTVGSGGGFSGGFGGMSGGGGASGSW